MRISEAALAVIRGPGDDESTWLTRWNARWSSFHLVGGHRQDRESFRDCLVRELFEELGLRQGSGYEIVRDVPQIFEYFARSEAAGIETRYKIALFPVALAEPGEAFDSRAETRWVRTHEILRGWADDDLPVSRTTGFLLAKAGIL